VDETAFRQILALGHEQTGVEFKSPGPKTDKHLFAKVARATLSMANSRNGGMVIVGVGEEDDGKPIPLGLEPDDLKTWTFDDVSDSIAVYADPSVVFEIEEFLFEDRIFVILHIDKFEDIPVICKKSYPGVLRDGACYVRPRRKPESSEIPSQADMRDLLDLALEIRLRRYLRLSANAGIVIRPQSKEDEVELFVDQLGDFFGKES
jgi:predicted HTH transcriptional regulator